jgi:diaminopimelate decarboxylase
MSSAPSGLTEGLVSELFSTRDGVLCVGGMPVPELAEAHGTPLYIYDAGLLRRRLQLLRRHLPSRVEVFFSVKANPNPEVIRVFVEEGAGTEVASAAEYLRARAAGCASERILFAGPGKGADELEEVVRQGIGEVHVESLEELAVLDALGRRAGTPVPVAVRVNPSVAIAGGAMRMGGLPAAFGFDEEGLEEVVRAVEASPGVRLQGLHQYAGTQILDAEVLAAQWKHAVELAGRLAALVGRPLSRVDLGGGLGIPYFPHESPLALATVQALMEPVFAALDTHPLLARTRFVVEPGRFLAGPAGLYLCRVRSVKQSRGTTFLVLDGGLHHHLAASGNLGQAIKRDYPLLNASRMSEAPAPQPVTVVGPLCTPLDTLGRQARLPQTRPGDLVAVLQSGAYGLTTSPVGFLSHPMPAEVLVDEGRARRIRERGTFTQPLVALP